MTKQKSTHGGKREGAGRKPQFDQPTKPRTVRLTDDQFEYLCELHGSLQRAVLDLIDNDQATKWLPGSKGANFGTD